MAPLSPTSLPGRPPTRRWPIDQTLVQPGTEGRKPSIPLRQLETALSRNRIDHCREILAWRPQTAREANQFGCTPLMMAASREAAELLLPLSDPLAFDDDGGTALGYFAQFGLPECLALILPHADPSAVDMFGQTALAQAAKEGQAECVALLIPASDLRAKARNGHCPLSLAIAAGSSESARLLIPGSDMGFRMDGGRSLLHIAARHARPDSPGSAIVDMLVGRCDATLRGPQGEDALMAALGKGFCAAAESLIPVSDLTAVDANGRLAVEHLRLFALSLPPREIPPGAASLLSRLPLLHRLAEAQSLAAACSGALPSPSARRRI